MSTTSGERTPRFPHITMAPARRTARRGIVAAIDGLLIIFATAIAIALVIRLPEGQISTADASLILGISLVTRLLPMALSSVYDIEWKRANAWDLVVLFRAIAIGVVLFTAVLFIVNPLQWSLIELTQFALADVFLTGTALGTSRIGVRVATEWRMRSRSRSRGRVLIVGAGDAGAQIARAMAEEVGAGYVGVAFADDDERKKGRIVHGIRVHGTRQQIPEMVTRLKVSEIWIAMPSASGKVIQETVRIGRSAGISQIKVVPGFSTLVSGVVRLADVRDVQIEELLGRDPVKIDTTQVSEFLAGKAVLVTGGAGSIGSELCRQISRFKPKLLVVLDQDETGVFNTKRALDVETGGQVRVESAIADVRDIAEVDEVFSRFKPQIVFHAAAYKHVPLMEDHPDRAAKTNVFGTRTVARVAKMWNAEKFVMISTDKAVNPTSIMGATKRAAELLVKEMGESGNVSFVSVRFGNVLGSRGSVIPIFTEQIARGGPVTVTDPEMRRYFMTIPEAVLLVLQAGAMGDNGQVFVLDMGEPVKIVDLARQLIVLSGLEPDKDIPIVYTGIRPGEKMFEDILSAEEDTSATSHDRIFISRTGESTSSAEITHGLKILSTAIESGDKQAVVSALRELVVTFRPESNTKPVREMKQEISHALAD